MAAILGKVALDISYKRRLFIKSVLKEEYKELASTTHEVTDFLFGDNLAKQVKDLNLTNKLSYKYTYVRIQTKIGETKLPKQTILSFEHFYGEAYETLHNIAVLAEDR